MSTRLWGLSGTILLAAAVTPVFGIASVTSSEQYVNVHVQGNLEGRITDTSPGPFDEFINQLSGTTTADASQTSDLDSLIFRGFGQTNIQGIGDPFAFANSGYEVSFELSESHAYSLTGLLSLAVDGAAGSTSFLLTGPGVNLSVSKLDSGSTPLNDHGVLGPGKLRNKRDRVFRSGRRNVFQQSSHIRFRPDAEG